MAFEWTPYQGRVHVHDSTLTDLLTKQIQARIEITRINRQLLMEGVSSAPLPPLTWRQRLWRHGDRVCAYMTTLWRALKGDDPYDVEWED